ncbi:hypothetical protein LZC95_26255 [Pendulispora brunnea]|uniref:IPT/TIG domain-containing protein n=1 Tax=Pendulispora brunnea TaxID=2905690 RepID=A0ABZ2JYG6_9BACT
MMTRRLHSRVLAACLIFATACTGGPMNDDVVAPVAATNDGEELRIQPLRTANDPPPSIDGFNPGAAPVGQWIAINGRNFLAGDRVFFGGVQAGNVDYSGVPARISAAVPRKAKTGAIGVELSTSIGDPFRVLPTESGFTPTSGTPLNTTVVIKGTGFADSPIRVLFANGVEGIVTGGDEVSIGVTVPDNAATGPLTITTKGGSIKTRDSFTVLPQPPSIKNRDGFAPTSGAVGTEVHIYAKPGTTFQQLTRVAFKGPGIPNRIDAVFQVVNSKTEIITRVPSGAVTGTIRVTNVTGADATSEDFVVLP